MLRWWSAVTTALTMDTAPPSGAHEEEVRSSSSVTAAARGEQIRFCVIITVTEGSCVHQPSACPQALAFILQHEAKCSRKRGSMGPEPTPPQTPDPRPLETRCEKENKAAAFGAGEAARPSQGHP